jgi:hypothetical protein
MVHCNGCEAESKYSICSVVSTLGRRPRRQRTTSSVRFCENCLEKFVNGEGNQPPRQYRAVLNDAYIAVSLAE